MGYKITVTSDPGPITGKDAVGFGVLMERDELPDLRVILQFSGLEFRAKRPELWDRTSTYRAAVEALRPELQDFAAVADIPAGDQPWEIDVNPNAVLAVLESVPEGDASIHAFVRAGEVIAGAGRERQVDDEQVIKDARTEGFELLERPVGEKWCWGFVRGDDERYPAFGERRLAISYMADWLRRGRVFR